VYFLSVQFILIHTVYKLGFRNGLVTPNNFFYIIILSMISHQKKRTALIWRQVVTNLLETIPLRNVCLFLNLDIHNTHLPITNRSLGISSEASDVDIAKKTELKRSCYCPFQRK
jgi:hypothetical protein